ncbi:MAG: bifunctional adenosylcobinamide kinase/adenosylcobinamide-phosphate guanylyltransferase, partial [Clostridiales bacterium]
MRGHLKLSNSNDEKYGSLRWAIDLLIVKNYYSWYNIGKFCNKSIGEADIVKRIILVSGGARSGKSNYAQDKAMEAGHDVLYIATAVCTDQEMADRIRLHQENRPAYWHTCEAYKDLGPIMTSASGKYQAILLDCLTMMINNLLFEDWQDDLPMEEINRREK